MSHDSERAAVSSGLERVQQRLQHLQDEGALEGSETAKTTHIGA